MSLSLLARSPVVRQHLLARVRSLHATAPARSAHGNYHHLPFKFPGERKGVFGIKLFTYLATGFSLPFLCVAYQLRKSGGASA